MDCKAGIRVQLAWEMENLEKSKGLLKEEENKDLMEIIQCNWE